MNSPNLPAKAPGDSARDLVDRHGLYLRRLARALVRDEAAASDLEQETWRAALEHREPLREPRAWLAATAKRLAWTAGRSERRRADRERRAAKPESSVSASLDAGDLLQNALRQLDEPFRGVVVARYLEGLEPREIAERDGTALGTVKSRLKRGLAKLREGLDAEHGGERRAWCQVLVAGLAGRAGDFGLASAAAAVNSVSENSHAIAQVPRTGATAPTIPGGLWTAALAMKLTLLAIVPLIAAALLWSRGYGGEPLESPVLNSPRTAAAEAHLDEPEALASDGAAEQREVAEAPAVAPENAADAEFELSLAVEVLDEFGRPAPGASVAIAPVGQPFNRVGYTNLAGELEVSWKCREASMQVDVIVRSGSTDLTGIRRLDVQSEATRRLSVRAQLDKGSKYGSHFASDNSEGASAGAQEEPQFPECLTADDGTIAFRMLESIVVFDEYELTSTGAHADGPESKDAAPQQGTISGTVLDALGQPVPGYAICWKALPEDQETSRPVREQRVLTSSDGAFEIVTPAGNVHCTAGPRGNVATLRASLAGGEVRTWNPVISHSRDIMVQVVHPKGGDVDHIILEASYDDGETLWIGRALTSDTGHATLLDWPQPITDVAFIAPEKIASVPVLMLRGVTAGVSFPFTLPSDSDVTVLPVQATLRKDAELGTSLVGLHVFNSSMTAGVRLWAPVPHGNTCNVVLPGGEWEVQAIWKHGVASPSRRVLVDGDQPIDLGVLEAPLPAFLIVPEELSDSKRLEIDLCLSAIDISVYDSGEFLDEIPKDRTFTLPAGRYRTRLTDHEGQVRESEVTLAEGDRHELTLP